MEKVEKFKTNEQIHDKTVIYLSRAHDCLK